MSLRIIVYLAMLAGPAFAGWDRSVSTGKGGFKDSPLPHPLAYFEVDPCLRPASDHVGPSIDCWSGTPSAEELDRRAKSKSELIEIGKIENFEIYDLWYSTGINPYPPRDLRSVLIKTGEDEYREVDISVVPVNSFLASRVVDLNGEKLLIIASYPLGVPYLLRPSGLEPPDLSAIYKEINALVPKKMSSFYENDDYSGMRVVVDLYANDTTLPPLLVEDRGCITVTYHFLQGRAVVTGSKYEPSMCEH